MADNDSTAQETSTGEARSLTTPAEDIYNDLGVKLEEAGAVLKLLIADQGESNEVIRASCLHAVHTLLENAEAAYGALGEVILKADREGRQPAAQA